MTTPTPPTNETPAATAVPPAEPPAPQPATPPAPVTGQPPADEPLGESGKKALQAEREARAALEKQIKQLQPLMDLLGGKPSGDTPSDLERLTARMTELETTAANEREARMRIEVASEKGLTPQQAARLQGKTREELSTDADALRALFPTAPATPGVPKPDPSQGAQPGGTPTFAEQATEALAKGDVRSAIAYKAAQLTEK